MDDAKALPAMPLLTVITPCKNHLDGLRIASESLAQQSFKDWEHLVMDSVSTDGTADYCKNRPQTTIHSERDEGVEFALNKGLRLARGKYVTILLCYDALIDPDWLQTAVSYLEARPDYSMISACIGTTPTDVSYNYDSYPSGPKFNYYFFIAPWPILNETAFVCGRSILIEQFPNFQKANPRHEIFFHFWINFFSAGYLASFVPRAVLRPENHPGSLIVEAMKSGEFRIKEHDFMDHKRIVKQSLVRGRQRILFKDREGRPLPITFSRTKFVCALLYYKLAVFLIRKVLRRKIDKMQYEFCQKLCRKCVDFVM